MVSTQGNVGPTEDIMDTTKDNVGPNVDIMDTTKDNMGIAEDIIDTSCIQHRTMWVLLRTSWTHHACNIG